MDSADYLVFRARERWLFVLYGVIWMCLVTEKYPSRTLLLPLGRQMGAAGESSVRLVVLFADGSLTVMVVEQAPAGCLCG